METTKEHPPVQVETDLIVAGVSRRSGLAPVVVHGVMKLIEDELAAVGATMVFLPAEVIGKSVFWVGDDDG